MGIEGEEDSRIQMYAVLLFPKEKLFSCFAPSIWPHVTSPCCCFCLFKIFHFFSNITLFSV